MKPGPYSELSTAFPASRYLNFASKHRSATYMYLHDGPGLTAYVDGRAVECALRQTWRAQPFRNRTVSPVVKLFVQVAKDLWASVLTLPCVQTTQLVVLVVVRTPRTSAVGPVVTSPLPPSRTLRLQRLTVVETTLSARMCSSVGLLTIPLAVLAVRARTPAAALEAAQVATLPPLPPLATHPRLPLPPTGALPALLTVVVLPTATLLARMCSSAAPQTTLLVARATAMMAAAARTATTPAPPAAAVSATANSSVMLSASGAQWTTLLAAPGVSLLSNRVELFPSGMSTFDVWP